MSGGEIILYGYGAVCICMLIFNMFYLYIENRRDGRIDRASRRFAQEISAQLARLQEGKELDERCMRRMGRKLVRVNHLMAFEKALSACEVDADEETIRAFQRALRPMMLDLAYAYQKRDNIEAAYFAYFVSKHAALIQADVMQEIMLEYIKRNNLYCRVNAMQALYAIGTPETIAQAVALMSRMGSTFNEKILTDGLLTFQGDHIKLTERLFERLHELRSSFRLAVLNYVRFKSDDFCEKMYQILMDSSSDKEMKLSAIRYFGKYAYEPARRHLLDFLADKRPEAWEYAAVSATSLAAYSGNDVIDALMEAMHSSNWYVRLNASASLERFDLEYMDLIEVAGGRDRYAREMMMYRLNSKRMGKNQQKEQVMA